MSTATTKMVARLARSRGARMASSRSSPSASRQDMFGTFILPGSMVAPPFFRSIIKNPREGAELQWQRAKSKFMDFFRIAGVWVMSKPSLLKGPVFKLRRANILPTAKALHRTVAEAFAAGDKNTLRRVCLPPLYNNLSAQIDRRPKGIRREWSLLNYTNTMRTPRIVDHKIAGLPGPDGGVKYSHQVIVTISSRQRLQQFNDKNGGVPVPGSEKEVDTVENIILVRPVDSRTYKPGDWLVFGYAEETTLKSWNAEKRLMEVLESQGGAPQR